MSFRPLPCLAAFCTLLLPFFPAQAQRAPDWQQRVRYEMNVTLHPDRHLLAGHQRLTYFNHSPDTLRKVFYHLYYNAFQPGSMMAARNRVLPDPDPRVAPRIFELQPSEIGRYDIGRLTQDGRPVRFTIHDTVMEVPLVRPMAPGDSAAFEMDYAVQVPLLTRRGGRDSREGIDYSMSQWYPKMAAYDARGWHADPYIGREFYAPFGTFDVRLRLPSAYVVGGTGVLQNPEEVGHGYQHDPEAPVPARDTLTWHFRAENVHDFAWAADPDYRHDRFTGPDGIAYHLLYQPDVQAGWTTLRAVMPALLGYYSARFGPYPWPQFTAIQAGDGGMEYPMAIFITGGRSPGSLIGVSAHEAAHMWFYGALASNEADYAWMDEGLTEYATDEALAALSGRTTGAHTGSILQILRAQHYGFFEPLDTPSDAFETNAAYSVAAYAGGAMVADLLGYVVSDSLRDEALRRYFARFRFRHPQPGDLERVAEEVSGLQLDWFFDQFRRRTEPVDHALTSLRSRPVAGGWRTTLRLLRRTPMLLPVDLRLTLDDGTTQWVNIPLTLMQGAKPVPADWLRAVPWPWTSPTYTLDLTLPSRVVHAEIDPEGRTPDADRLDNTSRLPLRAHFLEAPQQDWYTYQIGYRPSVAYAHRFGAGAGVQARGQYLFGRHRTFAALTLWPQVLASGGDHPALPPEEGRDAWHDGVDFDLSYTDAWRLSGRPGTVALGSRKHLGVVETTFGLVRPTTGFLNRTTQRSWSLSVTHHAVVSDRTFRPFDADGSLRTNLAWTTLGYDLRKNTTRLSARLDLGGALRREQAQPHTSATRLVVDLGYARRVGVFTALVEGRIGIGSTDLAPVRRFRLGAASDDEAWRRDAYRVTAAPFDRPAHDLHYVPLDGPGPVSHLSRQADTGTHLLAAGVTLSATPLPASAWLRPLTLDVFAAAGDLHTGWTAPSRGALRSDAGFGLTFDVPAIGRLRRWTEQSDALGGLRLVARFPVWTSAPERTDAPDRPLAFRWIVGVQVRR